MTNLTFNHKQPDNKLAGRVAQTTFLLLERKKIKHIVQFLNLDLFRCCTH